MATFTTNCKLHQWEPEDDFLRTDFNEDFAKIDAAFGKKADSAGVEARFSTLDSAVAALNGRLEVKAGSYAGDGAASRTVSLGFTPKAVLVESADGQRTTSGGGVYGGIALPGLPVTHYTGVVGLSIVSGGFRVGYTQYKANLNESGHTFYYIALR